VQVKNLGAGQDTSLAKQTAGPRRAGLNASHNDLFILQLSEIAPRCSGTLPLQFW
jgi:hypothetical protein